MITPQEAQQKIIQTLSSLPSETVPLQKGVNRVLAKKLYAQENLPPFNNSAVDGYAVCLSDLIEASPDRPIWLHINRVARAGGEKVIGYEHGAGIKIMTGAPIPNPFNAVIMKEDVIAQGDQIQTTYRPDEGENIRFQGEDIKKGEHLLRKGAILRPYEISLLASQGFSDVPVIRKPLIAFFVTGDELVPASSSHPLTDGKIYNSNGPAMMSLLSRWGIPHIDMGVIRDDPDAIEETMRQAFLSGDAVIISGGLSVGDFDYTRPLLEKLGVTILFHGVAVKPGRPLLFGVYRHQGIEKPVFGLPGNPVAVLVCMEEFVRPALDVMQGLSPSPHRYHLFGETTNAYSLPKGRQQYLFCQVTPCEDRFRIGILPSQGSAMVGQVCKANALALSPIGLSEIKTGETLSFRWLD